MWCVVYAVGRVLGFTGAQQLGEVGQVEPLSLLMCAISAGVAEPVIDLG